MSLQHVLIVLILVLAALLFAAALLIYRRKGLSTKGWYTFLGIYIVVLLAYALESFFFGGSHHQGIGVTDVMLVGCGVLFVSSAWRWHPPTR